MISPKESCSLPQIKSLGERKESPEYDLSMYLFVCFFKKVYAVLCSKKEFESYASYNKKK